MFQAHTCFYICYLHKEFSIFLSSFLHPNPQDYHRSESASKETFVFRELCVFFDSANHNILERNSCLCHSPNIDFQKLHWLTHWRNPYSHLLLPAYRRKYLLLDISFIYISNVIPFSGFLSENPLCPPFPWSPTHPLLLPGPDITLHWGIEPSQDQVPLEGSTFSYGYMKCFLRPFPWNFFMMEVKFEIIPTCFRI